MARKSQLEEFIEFLEAKGHENDCYDILKTIYDCSRNLNIIEEASRSVEGHETILRIYFFYEWYESKHKNKKYIYSSDEKVVAMFDGLKDVIEKTSDDISPNAKYQLIQMFGDARDFLDEAISNAIIWDVLDNGDYKCIVFDKIAKPLFKNLNNHPDIALYLECAD